MCIKESKFKKLVNFKKKKIKIKKQTEKIQIQIK
jgi:hypothetical protein